MENSKRARLKCLVAAFIAFGLLSHAKADPSPAEASVRLSFVRTGTASTLEGMVFQGGSFFKPMTLNHTAILIEHGDELVLFDTGLGRQIEAQFHADMPFWAKPLFSFKKAPAAVEQLPEELRKRIKKLYLSHVHWDHASGLEDFAEGVCASVAEEEKSELTDRQYAATFPSQFTSPHLKWCNFAWSDRQVRGFEKSFDLFGDGTVVAVPLPGHSRGSIGLFVRTAKQSFFLVGDLAWSSRALALGRPKFFAASHIVDRDREQTRQSILRVQALMISEPNLVVVPAHDAEVQDRFGYFPTWIE